MKTLWWSLLLGVGLPGLALSLFFLFFGGSPWFVVAAGVLCVVFAARVQFESQPKFDPAEDPLSRWRAFRVIRQLSVEGEAFDRVVVTMQLSKDWQPPGKTVTLRFEGVQALRVVQLGGWVVHFDHLICSDRGADYTKGPRYVVRDRWSEAICFECASFSVVPTAAHSPA